MSTQINVAKTLRPIIEKKIDSGSLQLPTLPSAAMRIMELLRREDIDPQVVARTLEQDPLIAAQVVRTANSLAFQGSARVTNIRQAAMRLGGRQLRSFLASAVTLQVFESKDRQLDTVMKTLRSHSVAVSMLARDLAHLTHCDQVEEAYLAGLLHDVGKVVIAVFMLELSRDRPGRPAIKIRPEEYLPALRELNRVIGSKIISQWGLPEYVQTTIQESANYNVTQRVSAPNLVCFSNATTKRMGIYIGDVDPAEVGATILIGRSILGIDEEIVDRLCNGLGERVKEL